MNILVIEDEPCAREAIEMLLTDLGHTVRSVDTIEASMELEGSFEPEIVFTDIKLQNSEVSDLQFNTLSADGKRKIVVISGCSYDDIFHLSKKLIFHFIQKPVDFCEIEQTIFRVQQAELSGSAL